MKTIIQILLICLVTFNLKAQPILSTFTCGTDMTGNGKLIKTGATKFTKAGQTNTGYYDAINAPYNNYGFVKAQYTNIFTDSINVSFDLRTTDTINPSIHIHAFHIIINNKDTFLILTTQVNTVPSIEHFNKRIKCDTLKSIQINYIPTGMGYFENAEFKNIVIEKVINTVGINEYTKNAARLNVFPNPTIGDINIKFNASKVKSPIEIFDIQGRLVQENTEEREVGENNIKLNLESLSAGIYIVRVETSTFKITLVK